MVIVNYELTRCFWWAMAQRSLLYVIWGPLYVRVINATNCVVDSVNDGMGGETIQKCPSL